MDVIFDWNLGNMIYNGLITLRLCGFPFAKIGVVSVVFISEPFMQFNNGWGARLART